MTGLIVALDTADLPRAKAWMHAVSPHCGMIKLGLEFFTANGPSVVRYFDDRPIFLDLKFHDIPRTVARAVTAAMETRPAMLTVHAEGGSAMIYAAREALDAGGEDRPKLLAVVALTSSHARNLHAYHTARAALKAGADGLVCSPRSLPYLRDACGPSALLVVPGIRPDGESRDDHEQTMTPRQAARAGADWIVMGRSITMHPDPAARAAEIAAEIGA